MASLTREALERLIAPGARLPWIQEWLLGSVWTAQRYETLGALRYLERGERDVNDLEEVLAAAAPRVYDELLDAPAADRDIRKFLDGAPGSCAAVIFDGLSLREIPLLLRLAARSGLVAQAVGTSLAAVPSETVDFVETRLGAGRISPSQLPTRRDLKDRGIAAYYYRQSESAADVRESY